ncbi:MAG TPA: hypothetical protein DET40_03615 [Lentisphaeria bacterium]|nr:MAG: hypothetical protein A2X45_23455 [Lentisphaerae bacterium GWF2_50_93]HCE42617.1 hypothetical protein [Lentisphaeria bacterium]
MKTKRKNNPFRAVRRAYQELHSELVKAYWKTDNRTAKNSIQDLSGDIYDLLSELESKAFSDKTADFKCFALKASRISVKIEKSRKQIGKIIKSATAASKIAAAMDKALEASANLVL